MSVNVITIDSLTKTFSDGSHALDNINIEIPRGSLTAVIGRNGAGKSTLFNCIASLLEFEKGEIVIDLGYGQKFHIRPEGKPVRRVFRRRIGIVLQGPSLWPHFTVLENVTRPLIDIYDYGNREAMDIARKWLLDKLGVRLQDLDKYPQQLSGGQRRRVVLARTLATDPDILLVDEIEASLDPEAVENVLRLVEDTFIKNPVKTVLMVTHRVDFLTRCASKVIVLDNGALTEEGSPEKILERPDPQTELFIREVIDPSRSQWNFAYRCLESSLSISSLTLVESSKPGDIFQRLAHEVLKLITHLEPEDPHLVLMVTRDKERPTSLFLRGACKNNGFSLDGKDSHTLGELIELACVSERADGKRLNKYEFVDAYEDLLAASGGVAFDSGADLSGSLIAMMFREDRKRRSKYRFAATYPPIEGPYGTSIPIEEDFAEIFYYEFSVSTRNVYLLPMEWNDSIVGVLSIDTYSREKWLPFVIRQLQLIANLGATAIQIHEDV